MWSNIFRIFSRVDPICTHSRFVIGPGEANEPAPFLPLAFAYITCLRLPPSTLLASSASNGTGAWLRAGGRCPSAAHRSTLALTLALILTLKVAGGGPSLEGVRRTLEAIVSAKPPLLLSVGQVA